MSLQDIVNVQIDRQTASVTRIGFGTPMIMSTEADEDNRFSTTASIYTALDQLGPLGDNFDTQGVTYRMAQTIFSQNPRVDRIVIGKRANPPLMTVNIIPVVVADTDYIVTIGGRGPTGDAIETYTFNSGGAPTVASITAGVTALINAGTQNVLATDNTTDMDIQSADTPGGAATAAKPFTIQFDRNLWIAQNNTADPGIVTDLTTIRTATDGNDDWYALFADSFGSAEIQALAANVETLFKIYLPTTFDADVLTAVDTDVGSILQAASYIRTALSWHETPGFADFGAAWGGRNLPTDPGSITWKFKTVSGVPFSTLTPNELNELSGKNVNNYIQKAGINISQEGVVASGEFIDVIRGIDFITARLQENIFSRLVNLPKIPFTDAGIAIIENEVRGVMQLGISQGIFTADPEPTVTVPRAADVDVNDRANRILPDVEFAAQLAGAIHFVEVRGVVTV